MIWDTKKVIGVAVLVGAMTQIGTGLKGAAWLVGVPEVAYAAKETAEQVDDQFQQYLARQEAYTKVLNEVIQQRAAQEPVYAPQGPPWFDTDNHGVEWRCDEEFVDTCWQDMSLWRRVR